MAKGKSDKIKVAKCPDCGRVMERLVQRNWSPELAVIVWKCGDPKCSIKKHTELLCEEAKHGR